MSLQWRRRDFTSAVSRFVREKLRPQLHSCGCLADNRLSREQGAVLALDSVVPGSAQWCTLCSRSVGLHVRRKRILSNVSTPHMPFRPFVTCSFPRGLLATLFIALGPLSVLAASGTGVAGVSARRERSGGSLHAQ